MKTLPFSEVKMKLGDLVDEVKAVDEEIVITKNGVPAAILVSPDGFEGWKETVAIQADRDLMDEIREGVAALKEKKVKLYSLDELFS
ncbi:MAG: type II toxin-antitoxin system Phd/YefM family antitoxin [Deltaproteobacteria bacterium]|nr:type II toxin-antitoxin system Phd/YefM family antitoxin [Deltaproteobacteria bacterium]